MRLHIVIAWGYENGLVLCTGCRQYSEKGLRFGVSLFAVPEYRNILIFYHYVECHISVAYVCLFFMGRGQERMKSQLKFQIQNFKWHAILWYNIARKEKGEASY